MAKFRLVTFLGIRPDLIRMYKLIELLDGGQKNNDYKHIFIHSGQHFDFELDEIFYKDLDIRKPDINLKVGRILQKKGDTSHALQSALLFEQVYETLKRINPSAVMYLGDTNTVTSALVAAKMNIPVIHIEGGGRSFDWRMPEEKNRITIDHLADALYVYLPRYKDILISEGIPKFRIKVIGNIIVDAVKHYAATADRRDISNKLGLVKKDYALCTLHREENIEDEIVFKSKIKDLIKLSKKLPVVFPVMPRVKMKLQEYSLSQLLKESGVILTEPLGFLDFLQLEKNARLIVTDSGTVQEEALILGVPCLVSRRSTERPETIKAGATIMSDKNLYENCMKAMRLNLNWDKSILNPSGQSPSELVYKDLIKKINNDFFKKSRLFNVLKSNKFVKQAYAR